MEQAIGVDIGGTKIAFALIDERGSLHAEHRLPALPGEGSEALLDRIGQGVSLLLQRASSQVAGIGIGCPGHVDAASGLVRNAVNLGWAEVALRAGVQQRIAADTPIWIAKDANASALGELYFGAARGFQDFVYVAVGTGLGGGAVVGGELVVGAGSYAMEIGHMPLDRAGRLCACGQRGCPEMYASGKGLLAGVREYIAQYPGSVLARDGELTTAAILDAARRADPLALRVIDEMCEWLKNVFMVCSGVLNPALFVIGGGLGRAARDLLIPEVKHRLASRMLAGMYGGLDVVESSVGNSAIGAASLVWHQRRLQPGDVAITPGGRSESRGGDHTS